MYYYKAIIQYDGTDYAGFQWQSTAITVQSEINSTLNKMLCGKFTTSATSRTDSGVHALEQHLKICSEEKIEIANFVTLINSILPKDIKFLSIIDSTWDYKPSLNIISKEYRYLFTNHQIPNRDFTRFSANISGSLDLDKMNECVQMLVGLHDFCNFTSAGSNVKSTHREILDCTLTQIVIDKKNFFESNLFIFPEEIGQCYEFRIIAKGFLKQMIRNIISALWRVGTHKLSVEEFRNILYGVKLNKQLWRVSPPNGLFLYQINSN